MYARAVNIQFQLGKIDEASRIVKDSIVPAMKGQKGFKGQLLLTARYGQGYLHQFVGGRSRPDSI